MSSSTLFRNALTRFAAGVTVITAKNRNKIFGVTVSSFTSLSLNPPEILFCLDAQGRAAKGFARDSVFAVHILSDKQKKLAEFFAAKGTTNWQGIAHQLNADGVPVLNDAMAVLFCRTRTIHKGGDHRVVIGSVEDILIEEDNTRPLLYSQRSYYALGRKK
jgi:flavin reductase (DIM6/NTAB) family NADH-FMN oxidoreductase RutF